MTTDQLDLVAANASLANLHRICDEAGLPYQHIAQRLGDVLVRVAELEAAITWALGAGDDFPTRQDGQGAYWWRSELQKRASLKWDGEKFIQA